MSRHRQTHYWTGEMAVSRLSHNDQPEKVVLCGEEPWRMNTTTQEAAAVSCPDCSKKLALKLIAERPAGAPKLELVKLEDGVYSYYRFTYKIMVDGQHFGYVGLEGAYRKQSWRISRITTEDADDAEIKLGTQVEERRTHPSGRDYDYELHYRSKEMALADVPRLIELGLLKSAAQTVQDAKDWRVERARREAAYAVREATDKQERADSIAGLLEIKAASETGGLVLTNFQADAVVNAIALLRQEDR